jgi:hypothetical protein
MGEGSRGMWREGGWCRRLWRGPKVVGHVMLLADAPHKFTAYTLAGQVVAEGIADSIPEAERCAEAALDAAGIPFDLAEVSDG